MAEASTKVVTGEVRLSYANLFTPKKNDNDKDVWSTLLLIPKSDKTIIRKLTKAAEVALAEGIANGKLKKTATLKNSWTTLKDGDERDDLDEKPEYEDHWYMNVNAYRKPGVVDRDVQAILDPEEVYSGCYARVSINAYAFNVGTNKGITFGLNHVQKLRDGESLGGVITHAEDDFEPVEDEDDDGEGLI